MAGANTVEVYIKLIDQASAGMKNVKKSTTEATKALDVLKKAAAAVGLSVLAKKAFDFAKGATLLAARVETLGVVTQTLGKTAGYSTQQIKDFERAVQAQGITTEASRESLAKMMQAQIDLADSTDLARLAQDAAVIAGVNSSEAFTRLINVISSGNVRMARTMGLQVNFNKGYEEMAKQLDKAVDELTEQEKTQSRANTVLNQGVAIAGAYTNAMDSVGKQLASTQRYWDEFRVSVGKANVESLGWLNRVAQQTLDALTTQNEALFAITEAQHYKLITDTEARDMEESLARGTMLYSDVLEDLTGKIDTVAITNEKYRGTIDNVLVSLGLVTRAGEDLGDGIKSGTDVGLDALKKFSTESIKIMAFNELVERFMEDDGTISIEERGVLKRFSDFQEVEWPAGLDEMIANLRSSGGDVTNEVNDMIVDFQNLEGPHPIVFDIQFVGGRTQIPGVQVGGGGTTATTGGTQSGATRRARGGPLSGFNEVGEEGPEFIIDGVVIPADITKRLKQLGLIADRKFQHGGVQEERWRPWNEYVRHPRPESWMGGIKMGTGGGGRRRRTSGGGAEVAAPPEPQAATGMASMLSTAALEAQKQTGLAEETNMLLAQLATKEDLQEAVQTAVELAVL